MVELLNIFIKLTISTLFLTISNCQRVAPGVPPQQYAPPPPQQVHHQPQMGHIPQQQQQQQQGHPQHVNAQYNQQMHQGQPNYQQVPQSQYQHQQQQQHPHGGHHKPLDTADIKAERHHIKEHLDVPIDVNTMTEQELQFHYFKMHDADHNNKLDGQELIKSLIHWHEQGNKESHDHPDKPNVEEKIFTDDELIGLIEPILKMDDIDKDGYIDYPEFIKAQQKTQQQQQQQQQQPPPPHSN